MVGAARRRYRRSVRKALAVLAGPLLAVWLFLVVTTPLVAVILMLAVVTWQSRFRRLPHPQR
jgi:hypothetical protein